MRIIVCGGREYDDWAVVSWALAPYESEETTIIQGGASGADFLGKVWAKYKGIPQIEFKADWKTHGKAAGPKRNQQMLDEGKPELVIAFPGGVGTRDMIERASKAGVTVIQID
jgi:hypothetical protein